MSDVAPPPAAKRDVGAAMRIALDVGPLLLFFIANARVGIFGATAAFMVAIVVAMAVSYALVRRVSVIQLFSAFMVIVMGGLTIYLHDESFIKLKPTIYYAFVAALLGYGLATGKPVLQSVLGSAYPGLEPEGWRKLTRNWAIFFVAMAVANEAVWRTSTTQFWISYKLWGALPATMLFALANVPMLLRHGLAKDDVEAATEPGHVE